MNPRDVVREPARGVVPDPEFRTNTPPRSSPSCDCLDDRFILVFKFVGMACPHPYECSRGLGDYAVLLVVCERGLYPHHCLFFFFSFFFSCSFQAQVFLVPFPNKIGIVFGARVRVNVRVRVEVGVWVNSS